MRRRRVFATCAGCGLLAACAILACDTFSGGTQGGPTNDGAVNDGSAGSADGSALSDGGVVGPFTLTFDPPHVTADPGDVFSVTVNVARTPAFAGVVQLALSGGPLGITTSSPAATTSDTSAFTIQFSAPGASPPLGASSLTLTGTGGGATILATLGLYIGSAVVIDAGTFVVPDFCAKGFTIKAWGAGGGSGSGFGYGGPGGFSGGFFEIPPGEALSVVIGAPGQAYGLAGGGGGLTGIRRADGAYFIIAGGGGGGAYDSMSYYAGGAGGGLVGQTGDSLDVNAGGGGGSQVEGGAGGSDSKVGQAGSFLVGGNAATDGDSSSADGGAPGGGLGQSDNGSTLGAGGGGAGYFGGGGGAMGLYGSGGGGGSGFIGDAGIEGGTIAGGGQFPPYTNDPDYGEGGTAARPDHGGRIVVRFRKPY